MTKNKQKNMVICVCAQKYGHSKEIIALACINVRFAARTANNVNKKIYPKMLTRAFLVPSLLRISVHCRSVCPQSLKLYFNNYDDGANYRQYFR